MTILLDQVPADASRSTPRVEETPAPKLWANQARIVEVEFRACCDWFVCNRRKGPNISSIDPETRLRTDLFHPRENVWGEHFAWLGAKLIGLTPIGRATVALLEINRPPRVTVRQALIEEGVFPPLGAELRSE